MTQETPRIREKEHQSPDVQRFGEESATVLAFSPWRGLVREPLRTSFGKSSVSRVSGRAKTSFPTIKTSGCMTKPLTSDYSTAYAHGLASGICRFAKRRPWSKKSQRGCNIFSKGCSVGRQRQVFDLRFFEVWAKVSSIWPLLRLALSQRVDCRFSWLNIHPLSVTANSALWKQNFLRSNLDMEYPDTRDRTLQACSRAHKKTFGKGRAVKKQCEWLAEPSF